MVARWMALPVLALASGCWSLPCQARAGEIEGRRRECDLRVDEGSSLLQHTLTSNKLGLDRGAESLRGVHIVKLPVCTVALEDGSQGVPHMGNLSFIHIPRTAGTSIEDCSKAAPEQERWAHANPAFLGKDANVTHCFLQHVPPSLRPELYAGRDTFCVVRDPYARAISQLGYLVGFFPKSHGCNATSLNGFLRKSLPEMSRHPYNEDCHLLPQTAYVYGWDAKNKTVRREGPRSCARVLRYETLDRDFNRTMEERGLPYRLSFRSIKSINAVTKSPSACWKLSVDDLEEDVRRLIEQVYEADFALLGYERLPPRS